MLLLLNNNNTAATVYSEVFPQGPGTFLSVWHTFKYLSSIKSIKQNTKGFGTTASKVRCFRVCWFLCPITQTKTQVQVPALLLTNRVTSGSSFPLSKPVFSSLKWWKELPLIHRVIVKAKWDQSHVSLVATRWSQLREGSHMPWYQQRWSDPWMAII